MFCSWKRLHAWSAEPSCADAASHASRAATKLADMFVPADGWQSGERSESELKAGYSSTSSREHMLTAAEMRQVCCDWTRACVCARCVCRWRWSCSCRRSVRRRPLGRLFWSRRGGTGSWRWGSPRARLSSSLRRWPTTRACAGKPEFKETLCDASSRDGDVFECRSDSSWRNHRFPLILSLIIFFFFVFFLFVFSSQ